MKIFWREKQYDEKMRTSCIQIMIWVGLVLIQMMIVGCLTVRAEIQEGGKETIEKKLEYTQLEEGMDFPETIEVQVKTEQGTETVLCRAAEQRVTGERWLEDFSFPVTFHRYHSDYYRLGEFLVPFQEEKPKLEGCESELLRQLGLSSDAYEILDFQCLCHGRAEPIWDRTERSAVTESEQGGVWYGIIWLHTGEPIRGWQKQRNCRKARSRSQMCRKPVWEDRERIPGKGRKLYREGSFPSGKRQRVFC